MKKLLFSAYFLSCFYLPAVAQDNTDGIRNKDFTLGISHGFDYGSAWYTADDAAFSGQRDSLNNFIAPAVGYRICFSALKETGYRTFLEVGVQFNFKEHQTSMLPSAPNPQFPNQAVNRSNFVRYNYLELPIGFNYILADSRFRLTAVAGIVPGLLTRTYTEERFWINGEVRWATGEAVPKSANDRAYCLDGYAGLGVAYDVTGNLSLRLQPTYRQSLVSVTEGPLKKYLQAGSLQVSAFYLIER